MTSLQLTHIPFAPHQVAKLEGMTRWMRFVGAFQIAVAGCIALFFGVALWRDEHLGYAMTVVSMLPITAALGYVYQGLLLQQAADYFHRLQDHEDDQDYLLNGMRRLQTAFLVEAVALGLMILQVVGLMVGIEGAH